MTSPYFLEVEIPGLPKRVNEINYKHRMAISREANLWKGLVAYAVRALRPPKPLKRAKLTLVRYSARCPDFDGLVSSFKWVLDGLVLARVIENDSMKVIGRTTYEWEPARPGRGKIRIRVEDVPEEGETDGREKGKGSAMDVQSVFETHGESTPDRGV